MMALIILWLLIFMAAAYLIFMAAAYLIFMAAAYLIFIGGVALFLWSEDRRMRRRRRHGSS